MASMKGVIDRLLRRRVAGLHDRVDALALEVGALREVVLELNHVITELNHDIRSGAEEGLPLFLGYAERLRLDTETAISAARLIDRQLALLGDLERSSPDAELD